MERLAQIDQARENLLSALSAVDEVKAAAERNKAELRDAIEQIEQTRVEQGAGRNSSRALSKSHRLTWKYSETLPGSHLHRTGSRSTGPRPINDLASRPQVQVRLQYEVTF
jgi:hypothetical protein